ncbi:MAG: class I SAM-dependent methyltransferase [Snowella sp.]|nr:class I SAM-dependent methyltransferase [Snowella sp.]
MKNYNYVGTELELFSEAKNWKNYYYQMIRRYLGAEVLEVGAGIGGTTKVLCRQKHERWVCLEPDSMLVDTLKTTPDLPPICEIQQGILAELPDGESFDAILYIDVLEHIEADQREVQRAMTHLKPGGFLIVLAPAHQWLFSPFDRAVGHYRRYNHSMMKKLTPEGLKIVRLNYLDSVGLCASLSNRWLKQRMPTQGQIKLWDTWMVPLSKMIDPILQYTIGKSILGVWKKNNETNSY